MTIWKFKLEFQQMQEIEMPKDAKILTVQIDQKNNAPTIWAMVEPKNQLESRFIELLTTGGDVPLDMGVDRIYIGTYQYQKGEFVGHVFERL